MVDDEPKHTDREGQLFEKARLTDEPRQTLTQEAVEAMTVNVIRGKTSGAPPPPHVMRSSGKTGQTGA